MQFKKVTSTGYVFDNRIFLVVVLILFSVVGFIMYKDGINPTPYVECKEDYCPNPLLTQKCQGAVCNIVKCEESWCTQETLTKGEYGKKPLKTEAFFLLGLSLFVLAFFVNHKIYNVGKKFDFGFNDSPLGKVISKLPKDEDSNNKRE